MGETLDLATLIVRLQADIQQYQADIKAARTSATEFEKTTENLDKELGALSKGGLKEAGQAVDQFARKGADSLGELEDGLKGVAPAVEGMGRSFGQAGTAVDSTSVRMAAYEAKAREARAALNALGTEVSSGNKTLEQAAAEYNKIETELEQYRQELNLADNEQEQFNDGVVQGGLKWTEFASKLSLARQAFDMLVGVGREVYETIGEGAALELASQRFDNLTASIGSTSEALLQDLSAATGGMMSDSQMMASASQIISLGLADTQGGVVDLASLVSQLGWDMQQVILTFANNSKARLDALGLSVTDVTARMKEFEAQGYNTDQAFDMAVIAAGKDKLELLGSAAGTTAGKLKVFEASWYNARDALTSWLTTAALPTIDALTTILQLATMESSSIAEATTNANNAANTYAALAGRVGQTAEAWRLSHTFLGQFTGLQDEATRATIDSMVALARESETHEQFREGLRSAGISIVDFVDLLQDAGMEAYKGTEGFYDYAKSSVELMDGFGEAGDAAERLAASIAQQEAERRVAFNGMAIFNTALTTGAAATGLMADAQDAATDKVYEFAKAQNDAKTAVIAAINAEKASYSSITSTLDTVGDSFHELFSAQIDLADAQGEWVTGYRDNSQEISDINAQLAADLDKDTQKAYQDILKTVDEGSAEWLAAWDMLQGDMTDSQRAALVAQRAELQAANGEMTSFFTGSSEDAEEAQKRIAAAEAEISKSLHQIGLSAVQAGVQAAIASGDMGALEGALAGIQSQVAYGMITQEEADAMSDFAVKTDKVTTATNLLLDQYLAKGPLTEQEINNLAAVVGLVEQNTNLSAEAVAYFADQGVTDFYDVNVAAVDLQTSMVELADGEYPIGVDASDVDNAIETTIALLDQLHSIPSDIPVHVSVTSDPLPDFPSGPDANKPGGEQAYASGGYTGAAGGMVHPNEFVFSPEAVRGIGVGALSDMHNAARNGDFSRVGGGGVVIQLSVDARGNDNAEEIARMTSDELMTAVRRMGLTVG